MRMFVIDTSVYTIKESFKNNYMPTNKMDNGSSSIYNWYC